MPLLKSSSIEKRYLHNPSRIYKYRRRTGCGTNMSSSPRETGSPSYSDRSTPCVETRHDMSRDHTDSRGFQAFLVDQLAKVQEQNENLLAKVARLEKEHEEYYISGQKKMEIGFRHVAKCTEDVAAMKEIFKEIVGIMTGERVKFVDHSHENVTNEEAERVASSTLLASNSRLENRARARQYRSDYAVLHGQAAVKLEESEAHMDLLQGSRNSFSSDERGRELFRVSSNMYSEHSASDAPNNDIHRNDDAANDNANSRLFDGPAMDNVPNYRMNRAIQSVQDVAREYFEGLPGRPSLMYLERRYGSSWRRSAKERTLFAKRMCIIHKINNIKDNPKKYGLPDKLHRNQAIKIIENVRLGNNNFKGHACRLSLSQLYTYFSKKMDKLEDYSLDLKTKGEPRRNHLMRERMARLEQNAADSRSAETVESASPSADGITPASATSNN